MPRSPAELYADLVDPHTLGWKVRAIPHLQCELKCTRQPVRREVIEGKTGGKNRPQCRHTCRETTFRVFLALAPSSSAVSMSKKGFHA